MKKIKRTLKAFLAVAAMFATMSFSGCMNMLDANIEEGGSRTRVTDISSLMNRAAVNNMVYMGGSVLYSEENAMANQLAEKVVVATRIGTVDITQTGNGNSVGIHNKEATYGYMVVKSVSMESISFDYYQYSDNVVDQKATFCGSYAIPAGGKCDLNGDGVNDVTYCKPDAGTTARNHRMWLKFLRNGENSSMFSVIAEQYEGGNYPGGLFGINTEGRSVVTKYEYSNSSCRSAVASIASGDYVLDTVENKIAVYHGSSINSRSARAINDSELSTAEFEGINTAEQIEFKDYEFVTDFNIYNLLKALPGTAVTEGFEDKTINEAVAYLNRLIRQNDFVNKVLMADGSEAAAEMRSTLSSYSFTTDFETVYIARTVLCNLYPDLCPEMTSLSNGIGEVFPELYVNIGHLDDYEQASAAGARAVYGNIIYHDEFDELYPKKNVEKYDQAFLDYAEKHDELYSWFSSFYYVDLTSGIIDSIGEDLIGIEDKDVMKLYKNFVKNLGLKLMVGATGSFSVAGGNPKVEVKLAALTGFEINDSISFTLTKGSFFEKKPGIEKAPTALERYKELYPNSSINTEKEAKEFFNADQGYKKMDLGVIGTTGWVDTKDIETGDMPSLTKYAKFKHVQFNPIKTIPFVITFDVDFDLLRALKISAECDNLYIGGVMIAGVEGHAGLNWGFSKKLWGCPLPWSFYCNFDKGGDKVFDHAYYAGFKKTDIEGSSVGVAVKGEITPVLKLRAGVGIGGDVWIAKTDITFGGSVTAAAPLSLVAGVNYSMKDGTEVIAKATGKLYMNWGLDVQFYLDPPIVSEVKRTLPIYSSDAFMKYQMFKITSKNFGCPEFEGWKKLSD